MAVVGAQQDRAATDRAVEADAPKAAGNLVRDRPFVVIRTPPSAQTTYGRVALATVDGTRPSQPVLAGPSCARVAYNAGRGLCLDTLGTESR